jgi:hypothetical protein
MWYAIALAAVSAPTEPISGSRNSTGLRYTSSSISARISTARSTIVVELPPPPESALCAADPVTSACSPPAAAGPATAPRIAVTAVESRCDDVFVVAVTDTVNCAAFPSRDGISDPGAVRPGACSRPTAARTDAAAVRPLVPSTDPPGRTSTTVAWSLTAPLVPCSSSATRVDAAEAGRKACVPLFTTCDKSDDAWLMPSTSSTHTMRTGQRSRRSHTPSRSWSADITRYAPSRPHAASPPGPPATGSRTGRQARHQQASAGPAARASAPQADCRYEAGY